jgi:hypothetical protein
MHSSIITYLVAIARFAISTIDSQRYKLWCIHQHYYISRFISEQCLKDSTSSISKLFVLYLYQYGHIILGLVVGFKQLKKVRFRGIAS